MKWVVKAMLYGLIFAGILAVLAMMAVVRLAPDRAEQWHVAIADDEMPVAGPCVDQVREVRRGARASCLLTREPAAVLAALDAIARDQPRTELLAGAPETLRMTWVSRSRIMGFPDYVTAEVVGTAAGTRLDILSRQRYGDGDHGVNAARLQTWLAALDRAG
jgi:uncharacterized protein (DUF1499 family)